MDVGDLSSIPEKCTEALRVYGRIDILVNNAGMGIRGTVVETELEVHQRIMNVNYFGTLSITKGEVFVLRESSLSHWVIYSQ